MLSPLSLATGFCGLVKISENEAIKDERDIGLISKDALFSGKSINLNCCTSAQESSMMGGAQFIV
jgi:hypothetical protein